MPLEERLRQAAEEWVQRARGNLARAKQSKPPEAFWEDLCFDAQQAAEKAVKAVLVLRGIDFRKTHDIADLMVLLRTDEVPQDLWEADTLTDYATVTRYPGRPPVSEDMYRRAVILAERVLHWAEGIIRGR
jgi:HEPN domain-containing protein